MTIASVLALVEGNDSGVALLDAAFALARQTDAYLEVLHLQPDPRDGIPLAAEGVTGTVIAQIMQEIRERGEAEAATARRLFEQHCAAADLPPLAAEEHAPARGRAAWRLVEGRPETELAQRGSRFDLIVLAQPEPEEAAAYAPALETLLFESGSPVLVIPRGYRGSLGERAVVAWNGRREAARALAAALPLLTRAKAVTVLSVEEEGRDADPEAIVTRLALHHIDAGQRRLPAGSPGRALHAEAVALNADLLVMGAYGHSRLREFVVGGVTRELLSDSAIPLFMAH